MRVLIAPNAFRDCLTAGQVAGAMVRGVQAADPGVEMELLPLSDGGDGLLESLGVLDPLVLRSCTALDPLGRQVSCRFLWQQEPATAFIEMAEISGLRLLQPHERNPLVASTRGTGQLIRTALDLGARRILLGIGGSATMDGGTGALAELGLRFLDQQGRELEPIPDQIRYLDRIDTRGRDPRLAETELILLCDVQTSLGASKTTFGPQKGARPEDAPIYQQAYASLARLACESGMVDLMDQPFLGAGGGLAAGLVAFAGATAVAGAAYLGQLLQLPQKVQQADLILSGEGRLDQGSLAGKLPYHVADLAASFKRPCYLLCGELDPTLQARLPQGCSALSINPPGMDRTTALARAAQQLSQTSQQLMLDLFPLLQTEKTAASIK